MDFLKLFADNLLPIFLAAGAGYVLARRTAISARPINHVAFYILAPCLVYKLIVESQLPPEAFLRMAAFGVTTLGLVGGLAAIGGKVFGWSRTMIAAVTLVALLPNAANYGLSANLFAFGEPALAHASIFFIASSVMTYTAGVLVASMGRRSIGQALAGLTRVPAVWAVVAAIVVLTTHATIPFPVSRTINLIADACIPVFLVILGMQLHGASWRGHGRALVFAASMRMLGGMAVGFLLAIPFGLEGPARQAGIFQAAMPSAVINIILAAEYEVEPAFVTSAVMTTTLLSPLILTPLMRLLGAH